MENRIKLNPGFRLELPTPSSYAAIWEDEPLSIQRKNIARYLEILDYSEEEGDLTDITDEIAGELCFATINKYRLIPKLMEIGAMTMMDFIQQISTEIPELKPYASDEATFKQIPYGCIITPDGHPSIKFGIIQAIGSDYLTLKAA